MSVVTAVEKIRQGLAEDPRRETVGGEEGPRDLLFTRRMVEWVVRLKPHPSEALLLAAWGHVLDRWKLPRDSHPKTTAGYHQWRRALDAISADATSKILGEEGIGDETAARVRGLILKKNFPADFESQILEDADCLAFLELKLDSYLSEWDESKTIRILKGTLEKMSPEAKKLAEGISYSPAAKELFQKVKEEPSNPAVG